VGERKKRTKGVHHYFQIIRRGGEESLFSEHGFVHEDEGGEGTAREERGERKKKKKKKKKRRWSLFFDLVPKRRSRRIGEKKKRGKKKKGKGNPRRRLHTFFLVYCLGFWKTIFQKKGKTGEGEGGGGEKKKGGKKKRKGPFIRFKQRRSVLGKGRGGLSRGEKEGRTKKKEKRDPYHTDSDLGATAPTGTLAHSES